MHSVGYGGYGWLAEAQRQTPRLAKATSTGTHGPMRSSWKPGVATVSSYLISRLCGATGAT